MRIARNIFVLFITCLLFASCATVGTGSVRKKYISQFVGDEGIQYFIKPITFKADNNNTLVADFTFRHGEENLNDTVMLNYTVRTDSKMTKLKDFCICFDNKEIAATSTTTLYKEKDKDFVTRYSSVFQYKQLREAYKNQTFSLKTITTDGEVEYKPTTKSSKLIQGLDESIFQLLD